MYLKFVYLLEYYIWNDFGDGVNISMTQWVSRFGLSWVCAQLELDRSFRVGRNEDLENSDISGRRSQDLLHI